MIPEDLLPFLAELKQNNHKDWFDINRSRYKNLRTAFIQTVSLIIHELSGFDPTVSGVDPTKTLFRINRDIRFSKDKSPYKTNMGAYISAGGRKYFLPGYYLHIEPDQCMIAGGVWMPPSGELKKIRQEIMDNLDEFKEIIFASDFKNLFGELQGEKLKTAPRGFPKDHPDIGLLRYKSYTVIRQVPDSFFFKPDAFGELINSYKKMHPLNVFLTNALSQE